MSRRPIVFLLAITAALSSLIQFSFSSLQQDDFYHIRLAAMIPSRGVIREFPWLEHTILNKQFVDGHFLYHVLLIPFTFGDPVIGAKVSTIVFMLLAAFVLYRFLERRQINHPVFWVLILLFGSHVFLIRLLSVRPLALSVAFLVLGVHFLCERKAISLGVLSGVFALSYIAFPVLIAVVAVFVIARLAIQRRFEWKPLAASLGGAAAGLVINPYFPRNLDLFYRQYATATLTREDVGLNLEWMPAPTWEMLQTLWPFFLILIVLLVLALERPRPMGFETLFLFVISALFLVTFCRAVRGVDQFLPFVVLFLAFLAKDLNVELRRIHKAAAILVLVLAMGLSVFLTVRNLKGVEVIDNRGAALWLKDHADKGALVFNVNYAAFPQLFFYNQDEHYTIGLDPNFMMQLDEERYRRYFDVTLLRSDPYPLLKEVFRARYIHIEHLQIYHPLYQYLATHQQDYRPVYQDRFASVFEVR